MFEPQFEKGLATGAKGLSAGLRKLPNVSGRGIADAVTKASPYINRIAPITAAGVANDAQLDMGGGEEEMQDFYDPSTYPVEQAVQPMQSTPEGDEQLYQEFLMESGLQDSPMMRQSFEVYKQQFMTQQFGY